MLDTGEEQNMLRQTGYPSLDRPWDAFYSNCEIRNIDVKRTIYECLFDLNKDHLDMPAIGYMGIDYTYRELKDAVDMAASAFKQIGLKIGDVVLIGMPLCPEVTIFALALNKLGCVSRWFDLRCSGADIQSYANESNCRIAVIADMVIPAMQEIINKTRIEKVIVSEPTESLPLLYRIVYRQKKAVKVPKDKRYIRYKGFLNRYAKTVYDTEVIEYEHTRPAILLQSSGTTGKPKIIVHTDFSVNSMINSIANTELPTGYGKSLFTVIPPWVAYGLVGGLLEPMALGTKIEIHPTLDPDSLTKNIGKFTAACVVPIHLRYLYEHYDKLSDNKKKALSEADCIISGGDKISVEEYKAFEKKFGVRVLNGYGCSECLGTITLHPISKVKYGTVGIPKYGDVIAAFDVETGKECKYNEVGELCVITDTAFAGYQDNEEATKEIKRKHDGYVWVHTGDLCSIDRDGFVTLLGRYRRVITRAGFKISAYLIEQKICENDNVKECCVVEAEDEEEEHVPFAWVVLKTDADSSELAIEQINGMCSEDLKKHEIPKYIEVINELPYTPNRKYDISLLEKKANEYVKKRKA